MQIYYLILNMETKLCFFLNNLLIADRFTTLQLAFEHIVVDLCPGSGGMIILFFNT